MGGHIPKQENSVPNMKVKSNTHEVKELWNKEQADIATQSSTQNAIIRLSRMVELSVCFIVLVY